MHIQIRTSLTTAGFTDDLDAPDGSVAYLAGSLSDLLALLAEDRGPSDPPFSLGAASGHAIELGGEFSFWVHPREGKMLLFPGWLGHRTKPFGADRRRISVAFDAVPVTRLAAG